MSSQTNNKKLEQLLILKNHFDNSKIFSKSTTTVDSENVNSPPFEYSINLGRGPSSSSSSSSSSYAAAALKEQANLKTHCYCNSCKQKKLRKKIVLNNKKTWLNIPTVEFNILGLAFKFYFDYQFFLFTLLGIIFSSFGLCNILFNFSCFNSELGSISSSINTSFLAQYSYYSMNEHSKYHYTNSYLKYESIILLILNCFLIFYLNAAKNLAKINAKYLIKEESLFQSLTLKVEHFEPILMNDFQKFINQNNEHDVYISPIYDLTSMIDSFQDLYQNVNTNTDDMKIKGIIFFHLTKKFYLVKSKVFLTFGSYNDMNKFITRFKPFSKLKNFNNKIKKNFPIFYKAFKAGFLNILFFPLILTWICCFKPLLKKLFNLKFIRKLYNFPTEINGLKNSANNNNNNNNSNSSNNNSSPAKIQTNLFDQQDTIDILVKILKIISDLNIQIVSDDYKEDDIGKIITNDVQEIKKSKIYTTLETEFNKENTYYSESEKYIYKIFQNVMVWSPVPEFLIKQVKYALKLYPDLDDINWTNINKTKVEKIKSRIYALLVWTFILIASFFIIVGIQTGKRILFEYSIIGSNFQILSTILTTIITTLINSIISLRIDKSNKYELYNSHTKEVEAFTIKIFVLTTLNSICSLMLSSVYVNTIYQESGLISMVQYFMIITIGLQAVFLFLDPMYIYKKIMRSFIDNYFKTYTIERLKALQKFFDIQNLSIGSRYSIITRNFFLIIFFIKIYPFGPLFALAGIILLFFIEKYIFVFRIKYPNNKIGWELCKQMLIILEIVPLFLLFSVGLTNYLILDLKGFEEWISSWPCLLNLIISMIGYIYPINEVLFGYYNKGIDLVSDFFLNKFKIEIKAKKKLSWNDFHIISPFSKKNKNKSSENKITTIEGQNLKNNKLSDQTSSLNNENKKNHDNDNNHNNNNKNEDLKLEDISKFNPFVGLTIFLKILHSTSLNITN